MGRQKTDIRVERQVDETGEGEGGGVVLLFHLQQALQPHAVILTQHSQSYSQQIQLQQIHIPTDHIRRDTGIANSCQLIFARFDILDTGLLERVTEFRLGAWHFQHSGSFIAL